MSSNKTKVQSFHSFADLVQAHPAFHQSLKAGDVEFVSAPQVQELPQVGLRDRLLKSREGVEASAPKISGPKAF